MASIAGSTVVATGTERLFVRGMVPYMKQEAVVDRRPGIDGFEIHLTGRGDAQGTLQVVFMGSNARCNAVYLALSALQGQVAAIVNDHGDSGSAFILHVSQPDKRAAVAVDTTITQRLECIVQTLTVS